MDAEHAPPPPRWPWAVIVLLALSQPLLHWVIVNMPPPGYEWSGLSIPDSALFLESMERLGQLDFRSSYATCQSAWGGDDPRYYAVPHLWLYGALGFLARLIGLSDFTMLGIANGLALGFHLAMVWRFLRAVVPKLAQPAFALFTLSGGPGGVLLLLCWFLGWHEHPDFETYFFRFAVYGLMEGPHFHPLLYAPRVYYTLSLGIVFGAMAAVQAGLIRASLRPLLWWLPALLLGTFIYARMGIFSLGVLGLMLWYSKASLNLRVRLGAMYAAPVFIGAVMSALVLRTNPQLVDNHLEAASMAMWLTPFLVACGLHLLVSTPVLWRGIQQSRLVRALAGYLLAYTLLALGYMAYYGTLLTGREGSVAAAVSDAALIGLFAGLLPGRKSEDYETPWWLVWLLGCTAVALSGWGQGWFLRFGPQRLQLLIWLPLCIAMAAAIAGYSKTFRFEANAAFVILGMGSMIGILGAFQSSAMAGQYWESFPNYHAERIDSATYVWATDPTVEGTFLAPPGVSDGIVRLTGMKTVYGVGTFNLTDVDYVDLREEVNRFFSEGTPDDERKKFVQDWCVDWIVLPQSWDPRYEYLTPDARQELIEASFTLPVTQNCLRVVR